ncbi:hypothetical protein JKP88DRAFT_324476 [Tribonema minus]|uniref:Uncharacterized protein n=1 Tax=Tribonema minus TaxID=303371 RepID=A0A836CC69_9STRA|nr:hypothetical protein JKP88DRAFT_324476 [Tribonema minus]
MSRAHHSTSRPPVSASELWAIQLGLSLGHDKFVTACGESIDLGAYGRTNVEGELLDRIRQLEDEVRECRTSQGVLADRLVEKAAEAKHLKFALEVEKERCNELRAMAPKAALSDTQDRAVRAQERRKRLQAERLMSAYKGCEQPPSPSPLLQQQRRQQTEASSAAPLSPQQQQQRAPRYGHRSSAHDDSMATHVEAWRAECDVTVRTDDGEDEHCCSELSALHDSVLEAEPLRVSMAAAPCEGGGLATLALPKRCASPTLSTPIGWSLDDDVEVVGLRIDSHGDALIGGHSSFRGKTHNVDAFALKLNGTTGGTVWDTWAGVDEAPDWALSAAVDAGGDFYLSGNTRGSLYAEGQGSHDLFITKFAGADGAMQWGYQSGTAYEDSADALAIGPDGNAVLCGSVRLAPPGGQRAFCSKFAGGSGGSSGVGAPLWSAQLPPLLREARRRRGAAAAADAADAALTVTGSSSSGGGSGSGGDSHELSGAAAVVPHEGALAAAVDPASGDVFVGGFAAGGWSLARLRGGDGAVLWRVGGGGAPLAAVNALAVDPSGDIIAGGYMSGGGGTGAALLGSGGGFRGSTDATVFKAEGASGRVLWSWRLGDGDKNNYVNGVGVDQRGGVYACGQAGGRAGGLGGERRAGGAGSQAFVAGLSGDVGQLVWLETFGTPIHEDAATAIAVDTNGTTLYVTGTTTGALFGSAGGEHDAWAARVPLPPNGTLVAAAAAQQARAAGADSVTSHTAAELALFMAAALVVLVLLSAGTLQQRRGGGGGSGADGGGGGASPPEALGRTASDLELASLLRRRGSS